MKIRIICSIFQHKQTKPEHLLPLDLQLENGDNFLNIIYYYYYYYLYFEELEEINITVHFQFIFLLTNY